MTGSLIAITAGILSLVTGAVMVVVSLLFVKRYAERKKRTLLLLALSTLSWMGASWSATVIYLLAGDMLELAMFFQQLVYAFVFAASMFTFLFAREIFFEKAPKAFIVGYLAVGCVIIISKFLLDSVEVTGFPDDPSYPLLTISLAYSLIVIVFLLPVILGIMIVSMRAARKTMDRVSRIGLQLISAGQLFVLLTFIADALASAFIDEAVLYAMFLYLTWIFPLGGTACYYLGWVMPAPFKAFLERRDG